MDQTEFCALPHYEFKKKYEKNEKLYKKIEKKIVKSITIIIIKISYNK